MEIVPHSLLHQRTQTFFLWACHSSLELTENHAW